MQMQRLLIACLITSAIACGGSARVEETEELAAGEFALRGAPIEDIAAANVTVLGVELRTSRGLENVVADPYTVDLMLLRSNARVLLGGFAESRRIQQIRIVMDGRVTVTMADGTTRMARVPSGERNGIKIIAQGLDPSQVCDIPLAFDPRKSFHETGRGELLMRPTIKLGRAGCDSAPGTGDDRTVQPGDRDGGDRDHDGDRDDDGDRGDDGDRAVKGHRGREGRDGGQVGGQDGGQVDGQDGEQVGGQVGGLDGGQVEGPVDGPDGGRVDGQVDGPDGGQIDGQVVDSGPTDGGSPPIQLPDL